jgi:putative addiction module killer protein
MNNIVRTAIFDEWLLQLKDLNGKAHIIKRIRSAERGNFGDSAALGSRVSEMRIHAGPGYRIYFMRVEAAVYVLLCAGTKRAQHADILKAKQLARLLKED